MCLPSLLSSKWFYHYYHNSTLHMSGHHSTRSHSPLKIGLGKIGDRYQTYCTTYKMHAIATCHGGAGCPLDRGIDIHAEDQGHADIDNENIYSSNATVALGGPEAEGHPKDPVCNNHNRLTALTREINDLCQWVEAGEGQPAETLDHIEHELQNLSIALHLPPLLTPTEPFGEVIWWYTDTLCTTQKQSNLMNSLLQDISVFNEHDSTKLEEWLMDIETEADIISESRAKLAKAKSRGYTHTLVTEVINSDKSRDEIMICYDYSFAVLIFILTPCASWKSSSEKRNPLQHTSTITGQKPRDATLQMM